MGGLPADLPAAVLVVVHTSPDSPRLLADILNRAGPLPCQYAQDQEVIRQGHLYLAPPNFPPTAQQLGDLAKLVRPQAEAHGGAR